MVAAVATGGVQNPLVPAGGGVAVARNGAGKPIVLYVGAEYCPYCAAERWSVIAALSRFGTFKSLTQTTSSSTDVFPDTSTFSFHGSTFTSDHIDFQGVEVQDRSGKPLDTPTSTQAAALRRFDTPPYMRSAGGFPFLDVADQFVLSGASFSPDLLAGKSWADIASLLADPAQPQAKAIIGTSNYITAAVCGTTGDQPSGACGSATIRAIESGMTGHGTTP
jgi:hypothetical protein